MWKVRELADKVTNVVMNYSEVEAKVREATNDDAWGPHGGLMQEITQYTFTYEHFPEVMGMLWKRMLHENKSNWRRIYKSLLLLTYLVRNGSERVVTSAREHLYDLRQLESYTFTDEYGRDQGINVRQKVRDLLDFIQDDERLREERKKAKKNKDKYIGMSAEGSGLRNYSDRYEEEPHNNYNNTATRKSRLDEIDDWNTGKKSVAEEAIGKVKDLINKARGFDEPPDYGNDDDLFDDDMFPSNFKKSEYKDSDIGDFSPSDFKTEKSSPSKKARSPIKKIDLGAAATYRRDVTDTKSQSDKSSVVSDVSLTKKQPVDLLGGSTSPAGDASADFADFNPRQFEANSNDRASGDFGDFSQFGSGSKSPTSQTEFADFANFESASQASPVAKTPTSPDFGDFTSVPAADTSAMSNTDLLSMPVLQPVSPPATQSTGILDMPNITQPVMGQQPVGMTMCMPQAPVAGMTGMPNVMGAGSVNVGVGMNMAMGTAQQIPVSSTQSLLNGSSQLSTAPSLTPTKLPLVSSTAVSTSVVSNSSSVTVTSSVTSTKTLPSKWANAGVDISLDNLSPASKFQRSAAPTINQLQSASAQPQAMPVAQPIPVGQPMPMAQPVAVVPAIPVAQPGAAMQTGGVMGTMMTGAQPGVTGLTTNMAQMNINAQGISIQPAVASQGMMASPAMPGGMGMQAMSGVPQQSMPTSTFQQRANQAFTGLGTLSK